MKYTIIFLLISVASFGQQTTVVKVPPSKDTTVVTFKTTTTTSSNTSTNYTLASIPIVPIDTIPIPPPHSFAIEGFGNTPGGNGKPMVTVTSASQLENAIKSNTYIKVDNKVKDAKWAFRGNYTNLVNVTIDGSESTFPVVIDNANNGDALSFETSGCHDIIVTSIAFRNAGNDCAAVNDGGYKIVFDHCSFSGGRDGNLDLTSGSHDITVQFSIIGSGNTSAFSGGSLFAYKGTANLSIHHNLYCTVTSGQVGERNPLIHSSNTSQRTDLMVDFRNNIVWKWGRSGGTGSGYGTAVGFGASANIVYNYYYSQSSPSSAVMANDGYGSNPGKLYAEGNVSGNTGVNPNNASNRVPFTIPAAGFVTTQDACAAAKLVLANVGPVKKDDVDLNFIKQVTLSGCPAN